MSVDTELSEENMSESIIKININHNKSFREHKYIIVHIFSVHIRNKQF